VLVLVTLFVRCRSTAQVAAQSPHGQGSILMLEELLPRWKGKASSSSSSGSRSPTSSSRSRSPPPTPAAHIIENPFVPALPGISGDDLVLLALLGAVFLKGFPGGDRPRRAHRGALLGLNVVLCVACARSSRHPHVSAVAQSRSDRYPSPHDDRPALAALSELALGLSGFETGWPSCRSCAAPDDDAARPPGASATRASC
jgi:hypothetical protein